MRSLVEELDQRGLPMKPGAADEVMNHITIEPAGRRRNDEVSPAFDQVGGLDDLGVVLPFLALGDEFAVVSGDVEDSGRRSILDRNREAPFGRDQADVADGSVAEVFGIPLEIRPHRPAGPVRQELEVGPVVLRQESAGPLDQRFETFRGFLHFPAIANLDGFADLVGDRPLRVDGPVGDVANQGFLLAVAESSDGEDRAGVGGDRRAEVSIDREPERQIIL